MKKNIQQRNYCPYPPGIIPCVECNTTKDNNEHVGLRASHNTVILQLITDHEVILFNLIKDAVDTQDYGLEATIRGSRLFDKNLTNSLPKHHPFYLLIYHHLILSDLTSILYNYILKKKTRFRVFIDFMNIIMEKINASIWNRRSKLL
uniref:Uncharacterized protein n=1 Tax=Rhizophagus irregularis (strain DAOM 181602 / DAOM 197198 / MUCL 43194) TaxID=747089 RepID=U9TK06_RHIID